MYDVKPTRTGGMTKNHFIAMASIKGGPFGGCQRLGTTSPDGYRGAGKIQAMGEARADSCGKNGTPGWWSDLPGAYGRGNPGIPSMIFPLTCSSSIVRLSGAPRPLATRRAPYGGSSGPCRGAAG